MVDKGLLGVYIKDGEGFNRLVWISRLVVPGLWRNLLYVKQATRNEVESILEMKSPRLETKQLYRLD